MHRRLPVSPPCSRVPDELDALDHAAAADQEHLHHRAAGADLHAEHVAIAELRRRHLLLAFAHRLHRAHRVAQLCGLLEPLVVRGLDHARAQLIGQLLVAPFEKQLRVGHRHRVALLGADRDHARRQAAADVVFEARTAAEAGDHLVARPDAEHLVRQRHRPARELGGQERTGVDAAVALHRPRHQHARKRFGGRQLQVGIVLVVAQQDVVASASAA